MDQYPVFAAHVSSESGHEFVAVSMCPALLLCQLMLKTSTKPVPYDLEITRVDSLLDSPKLCFLRHKGHKSFPRLPWQSTQMMSTEPRRATA